MMSLDEILAAAVREFILIGGGDGTGKTSACIALAKKLELENPETRVFVIDTENGWAKILRSYKNPPRNIHYYLCGSMEAVLEAFDRIRHGTIGDPEIDKRYQHLPIATGDWFICESMARAWEYCLPAGTRVLLADGSALTIGEIVECELIPEVVTVNASGDTERGRVTRHFRVPLTEDLYTVGDTVVTANHPIFTVERGYLRADEIAGSRTPLTGLEIASAKVRSEREANEGTGDADNWRPSRRRLVATKRWSARDRACLLCSKSDTVAVPAVEIRHSTRVGSITAVAGRGERWVASTQPEVRCETPLVGTVYNTFTPRVPTGWGSGEDGRGDPDVPGAYVSVVPGGLVYGRWGLSAQEHHSQFEYAVLAARGNPTRRGVSNRVGDTSSRVQGDAQEGLAAGGNGSSVVCTIPGSGSPSYALVDGLQVGAAETGNPTDARADANETLSGVRDADNAKPLVRDVFTSLRDGGRTGVRTSLVLAEPGAQARIHALVHEAATSGYVYDIEVAGNHDFFADGLLVHNSQDLGWQRVSGLKKREYLGRDDSGKKRTSTVTPQPDQLWSVVKSAHDSRFLDVLTVEWPEINVLLTTSRAKVRDPGGFMRENRDRAQLRAELGIEAGFEGLPRLPYYPDCLILLEKSAGKVVATVLKDRGSRSGQVTFPVSEPDELPYRFFESYRTGQPEEAYAAYYEAMRELAR